MRNASPVSLASSRLSFHSAVARTGSLSSLSARIPSRLYAWYLLIASVGAHTLDNLAAISAVVIGGTSLFGGIGTIVGSVVGTFIPAVLRNGFVIAGVQPFWQEVAIGIVLILAVYIDQRRRSAEERM
jgi:ribose transport system permease protein